VAVRTSVVDELQQYRMEKPILVDLLEVVEEYHFLPLRQFFQEGALEFELGRCLSNFWDLEVILQLLLQEVELLG
jgi:hypothetical protein